MLTDPDISHVADDELDRAIAERNEEMKVQADLSEISADDKRKKSALGHRDRVRERFLNTGTGGLCRPRDTGAAALLHHSQAGHQADRPRAYRPL